MNKAILLFLSLMFVQSVNHSFAQTATSAVVGDFKSGSSNETVVATR